MLPNGIELSGAAFLPHHNSTPCVDSGPSAASAPASCYAAYLSLPQQPPLFAPPLPLPSPTHRRAGARPGSPPTTPSPRRPTGVTCIIDGGRRSRGAMTSRCRIWRQACSPFDTQTNRIIWRRRADA